VRWLALPKLGTPLPHRLVGDDDPALGHHLLYLAEAEREPVIQPHAMADDRRREAEPLVRQRNDLLGGWMDWEALGSPRLESSYHVGASVQSELA
jgi:hypothetical protein